MHCPGSVRLTADLPEIKTSYAQEGTAAHALAEVWLRTGDVTGIVEIEGVLVTAEMIEAVKVYVDLVRGAFTEGARRYFEHRINLHKLTRGLNVPEMFGTGDAFGEQYVGKKRRLRIFDLKYGQGVSVDVKNNPQLGYYALGAAFEMEPTATSWQQAIDLFDEYEVTIVQPRAPHPDGQIRSVIISPHELSLFAGELVQAARATQAPDAPLVPGSWCRFCTAQGHCPALKTQAQAVAQVEFEAMPLDRPPTPESLPMTVVVDILSKADIIEQWIDALRARVQRELEAGREVPGWKLVLKRATRRWMAEDVVVQWAKSIGLDTHELYDLSIKSPAQVEKIVGKKNLPSDLYALVSTGTTLVPAHDPRPAAAIGPQHEFAALPPATVDVN